MQGKEAVRATLEQIDIVHRMVAKYPDMLSWRAQQTTWSGPSRPARSRR